MGLSGLDATLALPLRNCLLTTCREVHGALLETVTALASLVAKGNRVAFKHLVFEVLNLLVGAQTAHLPKKWLSRPALRVTALLLAFRLLLSCLCKMYATDTCCTTLANTLTASGASQMCVSCWTASARLAACRLARLPR